MVCDKAECARIPCFLSCLLTNAQCSALPMPGHGTDEGPHGHVEPGVGLSEAKAPLPYLRSRNALKVILDLDENFGRPRLPEGKKWTGIPGFGGKSQLSS